MASKVTHKPSLSSHVSSDPSKKSTRFKPSINPRKKTSIKQPVPGVPSNNATFKTPFALHRTNSITSSDLQETTESKPKKSTASLLFPGTGKKNTSNVRPHRTLSRRAASARALEAATLRPRQEDDAIEPAALSSHPARSRLVENPMSSRTTAYTQPTPTYILDRVRMFPFRYIPLILCVYRHMEVTLVQPIN